MTLFVKYGGYRDEAEKRFKEAIESAIKLCDYIYNNTDFCGVMKND